MGCVVNALGEAKGADVAIAFGKNQGLVIRHGEVVAKLKESELVDRFLAEVEDEVKSRAVKNKSLKARFNLAFRMAISLL